MGRRRLGSARNRLTSGLFPSWSSDGKRIIYTAYSGERPYLSVMNSDGSGRHSLGASLLERLSSRVADEEPAFSHLGRGSPSCRTPAMTTRRSPFLRPRGVTARGVGTRPQVRGRREIERDLCTKRDQDSGITHQRSKCLHWKSNGAFCGSKSKGQRVDEQSFADGRR